MKQNSITSITIVSVIVIVFCAVSAIFVIAQGAVYLMNPEGAGVVWSESQKILQWFLLIGRPSAGAAFFAFITAFLVKTIKGLKSGVLFPASNVPLLYVSAIVLFINNFCYSNGGVLTGADALLIDTDDIVMSLIFIVFAMIYKIAVKVSQENSLTI